MWVKTAESGEPPWRRVKDPWTMKVTSREYKVMLDHRAFEGRKSAAKAL